ncbi:hypothetical protein KIH39_22525 [Telmatocola sphagniphila]|uniref:Uncharacterized protein n=1 Tax=Telmatocola sphagniphila TaxID=1123043 RepID=A0A8E6B530_9BACT|nr:hypothetical protein [Telmatocola sphagniphila]QVL31589.1 hypothetical protein KIH39_22525 [Telmatocola sphagniphila]
MDQGKTESRKDTATDLCPLDCPIHKTRRPAWIAIGWLTAAVSSLYISDIPYDFGEELCGVWGCFPPLQSLIAMHAFWLIALLALVWVVHFRSSRFLRPLAAAFLAVGCFGAFGLAGKDLIRWCQSVSVEDQQYWPKRVGYILATSTDLPFVELAISGLIGLRVGSQLGSGESGGCKNESEAS